MVMSMWPLSCECAMIISVAVLRYFKRDLPCLRTRTHPVYSSLGPHGCGSYGVHVCMRECAACVVRVQLPTSRALLNSGCRHHTVIGRQWLIFGHAPGSHARWHVPLCHVIEFACAFRCAAMWRGSSAATTRTTSRKFMCSGTRGPMHCTIR